MSHPIKFSDQGKRLRDLREYKGFKLVDLSAASSLNESTLGYVERGVSPLTPDRASAIANVYHMPVDDLVEHYNGTKLAFVPGETQENDPTTPGDGVASDQGSAPGHTGTSSVRTKGKASNHKVTKNTRKGTRPMKPSGDPGQKPRTIAGASHGTSSASRPTATTGARAMLIAGLHDAVGRFCEDAFEILRAGVQQASAPLSA